MIPVDICFASTVRTSCHRVELKKSASTKIVVSSIVVFSVFSKSFKLFFGLLNWQLLLSNIRPRLGP